VSELRGGIDFILVNLIVGLSNTGLRPEYDNYFFFSFFIHYDMGVEYNTSLSFFF